MFDKNVSRLLNEQIKPEVEKITIKEFAERNK